MKQIINHTNNSSEKTHEDYKIINIVKAVDSHVIQVEKLNEQLYNIQTQIMLDIFERYNEKHGKDSEYELGDELGLHLFMLYEAECEGVIMDYYPVQLIKSFVYWQKDDELMKQAGNDKVLFKLLKNLSYIPLGI